ncbi:uncharacterized protein LOC126614915 isoform X1 [Malus sylvestris]|uniref:uncharacterized protein LOC126614915 isoform X1 n=1 Tax=Malus sylvestris TaxID=3752 RepID=UPI0021ACEB99|nr:uncharacterized protein LOC126614915 isoform X1 [Malus sylvestris]
MNISPFEPGPLNFCKDGSESRRCKSQQGEGVTHDESDAPAPGRASTSLTLFAASESTESNPDSSSDFSRSLSPQSNNMENAKKSVELTQDESEAFSRLVLPEPQPGVCIYNHFATRGIRVDRVEPGLVVCTLKVPPRLTDRAGNLANGAIANLVDQVGAVVHVRGLPVNVSVDISISFMSKAKLGDELEITSRVLGQLGRYCGTSILVRNKATGEVIAEGRHSLFAIHTSKL